MCYPGSVTPARMLSLEVSPQQLLDDWFEDNKSEILENLEEGIQSATINFTRINMVKCMVAAVFQIKETEGICTVHVSPMELIDGKTAEELYILLKEAVSAVFNNYCTDYPDQNFIEFQNLLLSFHSFLV